MSLPAGPAGGPEPASRPVGPAVPAGDAAGDPAPPPGPLSDPYELDDADPYEDLPREPYTLRRFLRELAIAVALLAVGLPLVLLLTRGGDGGEGQVLEQSAPLTTSAAPSTTPSAARDAPPDGSPVQDRPVLLLAGSSLLTDGQRVVDALGHGGRAVTAPGAGFGTGQPSLTQLVAEQDIDPEQDAVVVQGGAADAELEPQVLDLLAQQLVDRLRKKVSPSTAIVLIGPLPGSLPEEQLLRVRDVLAGAARAKSVTFVDPVAQGWSLDDPDLAQQLADVIAPVLDR